MDWNFYRFRSEWHLGAPSDEVFGVLAELDDYPAWWPEVRTVRQPTAETRRLTCRSALPYDLTVTMRQSVNDPRAGILEAAMTGDLEGFSRWSISASSSGTLAVFDEEVVANKPLLRRLALLARPAFTINHSLMMRHGHQGLTTYLAARSS